MKNELLNNNHYDFIIIGSGAAGLHLSMAMASDIFFKNKRIAVFDKSLKKINDKTFCFWEKGIGKWDNCVDKTWEQAYYKDSKQTELLNLSPCSYKKINAIDFYTYCKTALSDNSSFTFFFEEVNTVYEEELRTTVSTNSRKFTCEHVFDSRVPVSLKEINENAIYVNQSFRGWLIKTKEPVFASKQFTMMDYSLQWKKSTSFMYILPQNETEALFEYTIFAPFTISDRQFNNQITKYIHTYYPGIEYTVKSVEKGTIPMTNYNFSQHNSKRLTHIGTAGGWVKPSTGYSFKFAEKNADVIVKQLKEKKNPIGYQKHWRFKFYDTLLLKILKYENTKGPMLFGSIYSKTSPSLLFFFLDEKTNLWQELKIISRLPYWPFIKALFTK